MSKYIKLTDEVKTSIIDEFARTIGLIKMSDGKVVFSKTLNDIGEKATLYYTEEAWMKSKLLIAMNDKEIAWHSLAKRGEDPTKHEYIIYDVLVYPQEVTGTTVTTDQVRYQTWLYEQPDEVFNNIRAQCHSHVNMGVSPSGVDTSLYERILNQLSDEDFYIFTIGNKKGDLTVIIYDMGKNILFETKDVTTDIIEDGSGIFAFFKTVSDAVVTKPTPKYTYAGAYSYGNYVAGKAAKATQQTQVAVVGDPAIPSTQSTQTAQKTQQTSTTSQGKKGKQKSYRDYLDDYDDYDGYGDLGDYYRRGY
jgi:hypothetical protein